MCIFKSKATKRQEAALKRAKERKALKALNATQSTKVYDWSEHNSDVKGGKF